MRIQNTQPSIPVLSYHDDDILNLGADYILVDLAIGWREEPSDGMDRAIAERWPDARRRFYEFVRQRRFDGGDVCAVPPADSRPGVIYLASRPAPDRPTMAFISRGIRNLVSLCRREKIASVALHLLTAGSMDDATSRSRHLYDAELSRVRTEYRVAVR